MDRTLGDFLERLTAESGGLPISIDDAQAATQLSRAAVLDRFRQLQERGEGYLKLGRHGHPTRFYLRSKSVAPPAAESPLRVVTRSPKPADPAPIASADMHPIDRGGLETDMVPHHFRLRGNLGVTLELPADLSEREASRLARFIEALPL